MSGNQQSLILLDSNILIHILRNDESVWERIEQIGWRNCCISEISVVELLYGVECSMCPGKNRMIVNDLLKQLEIIPFSVCIKEFCRQKAKLCRQGKMIEDNDLYIATTALTLRIPVVTENVKHLSRIEGLKLRNWIKR